MRLVAAGGALDLTGAVLREFVALAGGAAARIVILPTASTSADAGDLYAEAFARLTASALVLPVQLPEAARSMAQCAELETATGIFFTGGNQLRITSLLGGTPFEAALQRAAARGAAIGGTSAGAAILSAVMLAYGEAGPDPVQGQAQFAPGLGFAPRLIFDQHFRQRDRLGRLLYAVANHPGILGVGLDENTAAVIVDDTLRVVGENAVTLVEGPEVSDVADIAPGQLIAVSGARVHVLTHGCTFDVAQRRAQIPAKTLLVE